MITLLTLMAIRMLLISIGLAFALIIIMAAYFFMNSDERKYEHKLKTMNRSINNATVY